MQPKTPQTRTYSFHFNRLTPTNISNTLTFAKEALNTTNASKNVNINFRYQSQIQEAQSNPISKNQVVRPFFNKEKSSQEMKKYTFSLLTSQAQQTKLCQNHEQPTLKPSQNKIKDIGNEIQRQKQKMANQQNYSFKLSSKSNTNTSSTDKPCTLEMIRQRQAKQSLQRQLKNQTKQNNQLKIQIKELENQLQQKDGQIQQLNNQLEELKRINKQNESIIIQNSPKSKAKDSAVSTLHIQDSEPQLQKEVKEWSNSTIIYNYEEEYKQILAIFEVQLNQQNYHEHLLSQIDKLLKKVEQANRYLVLSKQRQKQNCRLTAHIKKMQGQNIHLANVIGFLQKQVAKNNDLLQSANREIQIFNLKMLNGKYNYQINDANQG